MRSRITIEINFDNGQPYIKVLEDRDSDDVRDKLVTFFRQKLGHTSSWMRCQPSGYNGNIFEIHPITPMELKDESVIMAEQARLIEESIQQQPLTL